MNCKHCGAKTGAWDRFCPYCGAVLPNPPQRQRENERYDFEQNYSDPEPEPRRKPGRFIAVLLCILLLICCAGAISFYLVDGALPFPIAGTYTRAEAPAPVQAVLPMSPYDAVLHALPRSKVADALKASFGVPGGAIHLDSIAPDPSTLAADGILFECSGSVAFSDSLWKGQVASFKTVFLLSNSHTVPVYCKIGEKVFLDQVEAVRSDRSKALELLDGEEPWEAEKWSRSVRNWAGGLALSDYRLIVPGMTPEETACVLGFYGTETARSVRENVETATFRWNDPQKPGAFIEVIYRNGLAVSKSRFGVSD